MPRILVIDDRDQTIELCHRHLHAFDYLTRCDRAIPCQVCEERDKGCPKKCAHDFAEAAIALRQTPSLPDLVILDLHFGVPEARLLPEDKSHLPGEPKARKAALEDLRRRQGLLILERLRVDWPTLPVVLLTTTGAELGASRSTDPLVYFCENEIVDSRTLAAEIKRALVTATTTQDGPVFWGQSAAMRELRRSIEVLARSPLPVLVEGETGTGKSFLAEHAIHPRSGAKGPLVITDLSTIPQALLPAHLFGARRGAYTGAVEDHAGVFEQAHGGTLFLDEIANLDLDLQRQLLLVLERGVVTRLGDNKTRPASPKLVAATNQDLGALVTAGRFRKDLYMRLDPSTRLCMPALRERREDIPELLSFLLLEALRSEGLRPLVRQFLARFPTPGDFREEASVVVFARPKAKDAIDNGFCVFLSKVALRKLTDHDWPGNLRELRLFCVNALVHALVEPLDATVEGTAHRAPAILNLSDAQVEKLVTGANNRAGAQRPGRPASSGDKGRTMIIDLPQAPSFARISAEVEKQYMRALFASCAGDLERMGQELLGQKGAARKVHLRLNQLGLKLRALRGT